MGGTCNHDAVVFLYGDISSAVIHSNVAESVAVLGKRDGATGEGRVTSRNGSTRLFDRLCTCIQSQLASATICSDGTA